jgi:hypothetical protein
MLSFKRVKLLHLKHQLKVEKTLSFLQYNQWWAKLQLLSYSVT